MGFMAKKGNVFYEVGRGGQRFSVRFKNLEFVLGAAPKPIHLPLKARRGG